MRDFLEKNGLWVLFAAAVASVVLAVATLVSPNASPGADLMNFLSTPFRAAGTVTRGWIADFRDHYRDVKALEEENALLRRRIAEMEEEVRRAESDMAENVRLRQLLELRAQHKDLTDLETAVVTEHSVSNWTATLTLDKGTDHGISVGNTVIDTTGALVGTVREAGHNWCSVLTLPDTETSLGAQVFRTKELGVAHGDFALMESGRLRLDYLPADHKLLEGDVVVTSGLGGYYPAGMVIGTVEEVLVDASGSSSYAILAPKADFGALTQVAVVKSFEYVA